MIHINERAGHYSIWSNIVVEQLNLQMSETWRVVVHEDYLFIEMRQRAGRHRVFTDGTLFIFDGPNFFDTFPTVTYLWRLF